MKRHFTGDVWTDAKLLQAEELMAEARGCAARQALLRDAGLPRRRVRAWLGGVLLRLGHRVLGSLARPDLEPGDSPGRAPRGRGRAACPVCRSPWLKASSGPRTS